jgi:hypothetical protein
MKEDVWEIGRLGWSRLVGCERSGLQAKVEFI